MQGVVSSLNGEERYFGVICCTGCVLYFSVMVKSFILVCCKGIVAFFDVTVGCFNVLSWCSALGFGEL